MGSRGLSLSRDRFYGSSKRLLRPQEGTVEGGGGGGTSEETYPARPPQSEAAARALGASAQGHGHGTGTRSARGRNRLPREPEGAAESRNEGA